MEAVVWLKFEIVWLRSKELCPVLGINLEAANYPGIEGDFPRNEGTEILKGCNL